MVAAAGGRSRAYSMPLGALSPRVSAGHDEAGWSGAAGPCLTEDRNSDSDSDCTDGGYDVDDAGGAGADRESSADGQGVDSWSSADGQGVEDDALTPALWEGARPVQSRFESSRHARSARSLRRSQQLAADGAAGAHVRLSPPRLRRAAAHARGHSDDDCKVGPAAPSTAGVGDDAHMPALWERPLQSRFESSRHARSARSLRRSQQMAAAGAQGRLSPSRMRRASKHARGHSGDDCEMGPAAPSTAGVGDDAHMPALWEGARPLQSRFESSRHARSARSLRRSQQLATSGGTTFTGAHVRLSPPRLRRAAATRHASAEAQEAQVAGCDWDSPLDEKARGQGSEVRRGGAERKLPYRRRNSKQGQQALQADRARVMTSAPVSLGSSVPTHGAEDQTRVGTDDEAIEEVRPVRRERGDEVTTFYQLPPIMITGVRYVLSEEEQDYFSHLSSEDEDEGDEVAGLGRQLSEVFGQLPDSATGEDDKKHRALIESGDDTVDCRAVRRSKVEPMHSDVMMSAVLPLDSWTRDAAELERIEARFAFEPQGASFSERFQSIKRHEFAEAFWPEYSVDVGFAALVERAQTAYMGAILSRRCPGDQECSKTHAMLAPDRFLAQYFSDPDAFSSAAADLTDPAACSEEYGQCQEVLKGTWSCRCFSHKDMQRALESISTISRRATLTAVHWSADCELPDDPGKYLAAALQRTPVCCRTPRPPRGGDASAGCSSTTSSSSPRTAYNMVRSALIRHACGAAPDLSELEMQLEMHGMPGREYACDESLVCLAASYGDAQALALLYSFGANLNETQMQGLTKESSLETSASFGHVDVVDFLLQHGGECGRWRALLRLPCCVVLVWGPARGRKLEDISTEEMHGEDPLRFVHREREGRRRQEGCAPAWRQLHRSVVCFCVCALRCD